LELTAGNEALPTSAEDDWAWASGLGCADVELLLAAGGAVEEGDDDAAVGVVGVVGVVVGVLRNFDASLYNEPELALLGMTVVLVGGLAATCARYNVAVLSTVTGVARMSDGLAVAGVALVVAVVAESRVVVVVVVVVVVAEAVVAAVEEAATVEEATAVEAREGLDIGRVPKAAADEVVGFGDAATTLGSDLAVELGWVAALVALANATLRACCNKRIHSRISSGVLVVSTNGGMQSLGWRKLNANS
jgi:hypothetical protein